MRKFILIDQSIKNAGGHHLEYALRVLKAAKNDGFETVLAVNKSCKDFDSSEIDIIDKAFTYGFWENFACERQAPNKSGQSFVRMLLKKKDDFIYDILFSQLGFAFQLLSEGKTASGLATKYHWVSNDQKISLWAVTTGTVLLKLKFLYDGLKSWLSPVFKNMGKPARLVVRILKFLLGVALAPVVLVYVAFKWKNISNRFDHFTSLFGNECRQLFARIGVNEGDIVFVPTLGDVELIGISLCTQAKTFARLNWHLLFRRNLFVGREQNYLNQIGAVQKTQIALSEFKQNFASGTVTFYTDTDPLSEQWSMLGIYPFQTLPVPHDESLKKIPHIEKTPLIISYIGDARDEKGFQHLAQLVGDIRAAGFDSGKVRFRFQSNFNVPLGEAGSRVAKAELSLMTSDGVELLEGPFDSDEYTSLINTSDILLVPYDENNYYARSSGVFAEALMAGVPVVYPAKSWMGRELLEENVNNAKMIGDNYPLTPWNDLLKPSSKLVDLSVSQTLINPVVYFSYQLIIPRPGHYVKLSFYTISPNKYENGKLDFVDSILIDLRVASGACLYRFNKAGNFKIQLEHCNETTQAQLSQNPASYFADIRYRLIDTKSTIAQQAIGFGYESVEHLSTGVIEIMEHYEGYEQRSREFAAKWGKFHLASHLVEMLAVSEVNK